MMVLNKENILKALSDNRDTLRKYSVKSIGLFGSYAREENNQSSDLDFVVEFDKKTFDAYMDLKYFLEGLFEKPVDLVIAGALKPRLKPIILKETIHAPGF